MEYGATVLGVSHDDAESHRAFAKALTLGFPLVSDPDRKICALYGVRSLFLVGGAARTTFVIDTQRVIRAVYKSNFNVVGHVDNALAAVAAIKN